MASSPPRRKRIVIASIVAIVIAILVVVIRRGPPAPDVCPYPRNLASFTSGAVHAEDGSGELALERGRSGSLRASLAITRTHDDVPPGEYLCVAVFADTAGTPIPDPLGDVPVGGGLLTWSPTTQRYEAELHVRCDEHDHVVGTDMQGTSTERGDVALYVRAFPRGWSIVSDAPSSTTARVRCRAPAQGTVEVTPSRTDA